MSNPIIPQKRCIVCKQYYPSTSEYFWKDKSRSSGLRERCKNCTNKPKTQPLPDGMKRCSKCKEILQATLEYFHTDKMMTDGLSTACKQCRNGKTREYYALNAEYKRQYRKEYYATNHQAEMDYRIANKDKVAIASKTHYLKHKVEKLDNQKKNRKDNPEHVKDIERKSRLKHPEKAHNRRTRFKNAQGVFTKDDIDVLFRSQKGKCWWCGCKLNKYHIDHRIPLSRGGSNWPNNLCLACPECNLSKSDKMPWEWSGKLL